MSRRLLSVVGLLVCASFIESAYPAELITLRYGQNAASAGSLSSLPLTVAERKGFFVREGLHLEVVPIPGGTDRIVAALDKGEIDSGKNATPYLIQAVLKGSDAVAIAAQTTNPIYSLIVKPEIKGFADLNGKVIGLSTPGDTITLATVRLLAAKGIKASAFRAKSVIGTGARFECLQSGECAAVPMGQPEDLGAIRQGFPRLGFTYEAGADLIFNVDMTRRVWGEKNQDILVRFVRGFYFCPSRSRSVSSNGSKASGARAQIPRHLLGRRPDRQRTQSGTQNAGDLKNIAYNQTQVLAGQAYVEYFVPAKLRNGRNTLPVVMVPGGALIGVHFLTTPDGREGWADYFLRRGFPVYIVDVPGRGRAGFVPDPFNDVKSGAAQPNTQAVLRAWDSSAWLEWNTGPLPAPNPTHGPNDPSCIGNDARDPKNPPVYCNGNLMPALDAEGYKHWLASLVPEGPVEVGSDPGLLAVMKKIGPAIWLGHSQAGTTGGRLSNQNPEVFKAVIGIEPQGACNLPPDTEIKGVVKVPQFSIHGINQVGRPDTASCLETYAKINAAGGDATYLSLPKLPKTTLFDRIPQAGIWGNDHIMMWDTNSDQIADLLIKWIEKHIEKKKVKTPW